MFWIVTATERNRLTRIVMGEEEARALHALLLPLIGGKYLAVSLQTAVEEPMRTDEEMARATKLVERMNFYYKGKI